jgi:hypothetical protein
MGDDLTCLVEHLTSFQLNDLQVAPQIAKSPGIRAAKDPIVMSWGLRTRARAGGSRSNREQSRTNQRARAAVWS